MEAPIGLCWKMWSTQIMLENYDRMKEFHIIILSLFFIWMLIEVLRNRE